MITSPTISGRRGPSRLVSLPETTLVPAISAVSGRNISPRHERRVPEDFLEVEAEHEDLPVEGQVEQQAADDRARDQR